MATNYGDLPIGGAAFLFIIFSYLLWPACKPSVLFLPYRWSRASSESPLSADADADCSALQKYLIPKTVYVASVIHTLCLL